MFAPIKSLAATIVCLGALSAPAFAMEATQTVEREVTITQPDGTQVVRREAADEIKPGEAVVYTLDFVNTQAEPARDLVLAMPVPAEIRFTEGSADRANATVEYSTDGGQSFSDRLSLMVTDAGSAARPATSDDIDAVRWTLNDAVLPGESGEVSFKGRLR